MKKYKVIKNFATLVEGDIITVITHNDTFAFYVEGRTRRVKKYTLYKDMKKGLPSFIWEDKEISSFKAMEFTIPETPKDETQEFLMMYSGYEWMKICVNNTIKDLKEIIVDY